MFDYKVRIKLGPLIINRESLIMSKFTPNQLVIVNCPQSNHPLSDLHGVKGVVIAFERGGTNVYTIQPSGRLAFNAPEDMLLPVPIPQPVKYTGGKKPSDKWPTCAKCDEPTLTRESKLCGDCLSKEPPEKDSLVEQLKDPNVSIEKIVAEAFGKALAEEEMHRDNLMLFGDGTGSCNLAMSLDEYQVLASKTECAYSPEVIERFIEDMGWLRLHLAEVGCHSPLVATDWFKKAMCYQNPVAKENITQ